MSDPGLVVGSPVGPLALVEDDGGLAEIRFDADPAALGGRPTPLLGLVARQLQEYFTGERRVFDLPLRPRGTEFQSRVWEAVGRVPWGTTTTYGDVAHALGLAPGSARAVGAANGANPLPIVVPCHRVVGGDGTLTGYAGGLPRKEALLRLEGLGPPDPLF